MHLTTLTNREDKVQVQKVLPKKVLLKNKVKTCWIRKDQLLETKNQHLSSEMTEQFKTGWAAIKLEVTKDDLGWLQGCLIGEVKDLESLVHIVRIFVFEGLEDLPIKYLGGLRLLLDCGSNLIATKLLKQKSEWLLQWFDWIMIWNGNISQPERLIWLTIEGVPIEAWNESSLSKIASKWGRVLGVEPDASGKVCLNRGKVCFLTRDLRWINDVVRVKVKSKHLDVRFIENMEFNVDFDPQSEDASKWNCEFASDASSSVLSMEDEWFGEDGESLCHDLEDGEF